MMMDTQRATHFENIHKKHGMKKKYINSPTLNKQKIIYIYIYVQHTNNNKSTNSPCVITIKLKRVEIGDDDDVASFKLFDANLTSHIPYFSMHFVYSLTNEIFFFIDQIKSFN